MAVQNPNRKGGGKEDVLRRNANHAQDPEKEKEKNSFKRGVTVLAVGSISAGGEILLKTREREKKKK